MNEVEVDDLGEEGEAWMVHIDVDDREWALQILHGHLQRQVGIPEWEAEWRDRINAAATRFRTDWWYVPTDLASLQSVDREPLPVPFAGMWVNA